MIGYIDNVACALLKAFSLYLCHLVIPTLIFVSQINGESPKLGLMTVGRVWGLRSEF